MVNIDFGSKMVPYQSVKRIQVRHAYIKVTRTRECPINDFS